MGLTGKDFPSSEKVKEKILNAIEKEMERRGLSQGDVGKLVGIDRRNINKIFRGTENGVTIDRLIRIANGIGLDIDVIVKRNKDFVL